MRGTQDVHTFSEENAPPLPAASFREWPCHPPSCPVDWLVRALSETAICCLIDLRKTLGYVTKLRSEGPGKPRKDRARDLKQEDSFLLLSSPVPQLLVALISFSPKADCPLRLQGHSHWQPRLSKLHIVGGGRQVLLFTRHLYPREGLCSVSLSSLSAPGSKR